MRPVPRLTISVCTILAFCSTDLLAQSRRPTATATKPIDIQAERAENEYIQNLAKFANQYEEAGDLEKSSSMLKQILKVRPDVDSVKQKLKEFEESIFNDNTRTIEIDPAQNWTSTGIAISKDKPIRIEATGTYKFIVNDTLGPNGYQGSDTLQDISKDLPIGSLIAVVAPPRTNRNQKNEPNAVFVGEGKELSFKEEGLLLLKANVPSNAKCTGKIKVKISGNIAPAR